MHWAPSYAIVPGHSSLKHRSTSSPISASPETASRDRLKNWPGWWNSSFQGWKENGPCLTSTGRGKGKLMDWCNFTICLNQSLCQLHWQAPEVFLPPPRIRIGLGLVWLSGSGVDLAKNWICKWISEKDLCLNQVTYLIEFFARPCEWLYRQNEGVMEEWDWVTCGMK